MGQDQTLRLVLDLELAEAHIVEVHTRLHLVDQLVMDEVVGALMGKVLGTGHGLQAYHTFLEHKASEVLVPRTVALVGHGRTPGGCRS